jgi:hypothetical protein
MESNGQGIKRPGNHNRRKNAGHSNVTTETPTSKAAHTLIKLMMTNKGVRGKGANASSIQQAAPTENHFVTRAHLLQVLAVVFPTHRDSQVGKGAKMLKILSEGTKAAFGLIQSIPICKINKNSNAYYRMGTDDKLEAMIWRHTEDGPVYKGFTWRPLELSKPELAQVRL